MRLTAFTDYSLRVLTYAGTKGNDLSTIDEIADAYGISRNHLMKVVYRLGQLGYLETIRGKTGGMRLSRDPAEINLGAVVREMEESLGLVECMQEGGHCCIDPACTLKGILNESLEAFLAVLDRYTLADLLRPRRRLKDLLAIPA
ncbi:MAG TPA: Rrf2 family transcriptional regulator [Alphaproteobacteria bacterium]|nr:Rrf2 family transcriptional regulator [Alphaproteobacteria bacterium]